MRDTDRRSGSAFETTGAGTAARAEEPRDDAALVEAARGGDVEAYGVLVRRHQHDLYRHAVGMVGEADAEDLVQEALLRGYRRLDDCRHPDRVGGWLFRIVSSICKDHLKSPSQSRPKLPLDADKVPPVVDGDADVDVRSDRSFLREELEAALAALDPDKREAFLLKHLEGYTYREMADLLDATVPALKMRVHRARLELRERLEGHGVEDASLGPSRARPTTGAALAAAVG